MNASTSELTALRPYTETYTASYIRLQEASIGWHDYIMLIFIKNIPSF